jgi:hypothetical protein
MELITVGIHDRQQTKQIVNRYILLIFHLMQRVCELAIAL